MTDEQDKQPEEPPSDSYFYDVAVAMLRGSITCRLMHAHDQTVPLMGECWAESCFHHADPEGKQFPVLLLYTRKEAPC